MKIVISNIIGGFLFVGGFLVLVGSCGSLEVGEFNFIQTLLGVIIGIVTLLLGCVISGPITKAEEEYEN